MLLVCLFLFWFFFLLFDEIQNGIDWYAHARKSRTAPAIMHRTSSYTMFNKLHPMLWTYFACRKTNHLILTHFSPSSRLLARFAKVRMYFSLTLFLSIAHFLRKVRVDFCGNFFPFLISRTRLIGMKKKNFFNRQQIVDITYIVEGSQQFQINFVLAFNALKHIANWFYFQIVCETRSTGWCDFFFSNKKDQTNMCDG